MAMSPRLLRPVASGFDPRRLSGLELWFDAADSSTVTLNGTTVSEWRDKSSNGIALPQGNAANQPTYATAHINGRNALTFDGNDFLYLSSYAKNTAPGTWFAVFREDVSVNFAGVFVMSPASGSDFQVSNSIFCDLDTGSNLIAYINSGDLREAGSGTLPLSTCVLRMQSNGAAICRRNGSQTGSTSSTGRGAASAGFLIGARFLSGAADTGFGAQMSFCEFLSYGRALADSELVSVEKYLNKKWGVA
jgi:hypothetical protein